MTKMLNEMIICSPAIWQPMLQQQVFRGLLDGFSYPGRIVACADSETTACLAILIALIDGETTLADPQQCLNSALWAKLETRPCIPEKAAFILLDGTQSADLNPCIGTLETPETGATILLRVGALHPDSSGNLRLQLSGPGIETITSISVDGLHPAWITARQEWVSAFPLGVDLLLCDEHHFVAIPRTTQIKMGDAA
ncbi:phosphonate C-P lyase system protein PhnH [Sulfuriferula sp. AH1]|uniref:phosphonate C-P lyase system protein PhnH n=1 Tax=Sulfuriferula sp. AH1 TaxID=1985873 RepID=UPI000B3B8148|nr:phosphonate C-P lyase system protein PhnH [Sulfuriferula sp. AH1]ARU31842.1 phosphonate C-P lyase system protein PhnH [Sulfuriferula sp. AH1]